MVRDVLTVLRMAEAKDEEAIKEKEMLVRATSRAREKRLARKAFKK